MEDKVDTLFQSEVYHRMINDRTSLIDQVTASIDFFNKAIKNTDFLRLLTTNILEIFCSLYANSSYQYPLWLDVIAVCCHQLNKDICETASRLTECFVNARVLATGLALRDSSGKRAHLNHQQVKHVRDVALYTQKCVVCVCTIRSYSGSIPPSPSIEHPKFRFLIANLFSQEISNFCAIALLNEVKVQSLGRSEKTFIIIQRASQSLVYVLENFDQDCRNNSALKAKLEKSATILDKCSSIYLGDLFDTTGCSSEEGLDLPLENYLEDHEELRKSHKFYCEALDRFEVCRQEYVEYQMKLFSSLVLIRALLLLLSLSMSTHFREFTCPTTLTSLRKYELGLVTIEGDQIFHCIRKILTVDLLKLVPVESSVFGNSSLLLFCSIVGHFSSELQRLIGLHLYPVVAVNILSTFVEAQSFSLPQETLLSIRICSFFQYFILRGCSAYLRSLIVHWTNQPETASCPAIPIWISQVLEFVRWSLRDSSSPNASTEPKYSKLYNGKRRIIPRTNVKSDWGQIFDKNFENILPDIKNYSDRILFRTDESSFLEYRVDDMCDRFSPVQHRRIPSLHMYPFSLYKQSICTFRVFMW